jgi:hypothetical protein
MKQVIFSIMILLIGVIAANAQNRATYSLLPAATRMAGANVTILKDKEIVVRFAEKGISYKIFYDRSGAWQHTVSSYGEEGLPAAVRDQVKSVYHQWNISFVDEVDGPESDPVYRIQLHRDNRLLIVKLSGDQMETEKELISL